MNKQIAGLAAALAIGAAGGAVINGANAMPENRSYEGPALKADMQCVEACMERFPMKGALQLCIGPSSETTGFSYRIDK